MKRLLAGTVAALCLVAFQGLLFCFGPKPSPQYAESLVRQCLERDTRAPYLQKFEASGRTIDAETAAAMLRDVQRVQDMVFRSVTVRRALVGRPVARRTHYYVRVVIAGTPDTARYFWIDDPIAFERQERDWRFPL